MNNSKGHNDYLFVYGSLKRSFNHEVFNSVKPQLKYEGSGSFRGELYDLGEYPGAIETRNKQGQVYGEIYKVSEPDKVFKILDEYEEFNPNSKSNSEFIRKRKLITKKNNERIISWVYVLNPLVSKRKIKIRSGKYNVQNKPRGKDNY
jgi:gamma-glutamylcyclotransferase (GGCT)/AIG2-like uncharacterized protein YtfP